jgi:probable H4MPT-linked C1 transfer pathway protein
MIVGWDIGGAHVKAALLDGGRLVEVTQWPCPLWQGLEHLDTVLAAARARWPALDGAAHAVTMSGEMVDLFPHREAGVAAIVARLAAALGPRLHCYAGKAGFCPAGEAATHWREIASANWLASAQWVAARLDAAVLVDIGSTTTDLIPVHGGRPALQAGDDHGRLASGELVYLGVVRTPLCALGERVPFRGREVGVMNEWFATTADVYRLRGELDPAHDQAPSADGAAKDAAATLQRLARMIGLDARDAPEAAWRALADHWAGVVEARIAAALASVPALGGRENTGDLKSPAQGHVPVGAASPRSAPLVAAGCGAFVVRALAARMGRGCVDFSALVPGDSPWANVCAPACAVALLLERDFP